MELSNTTNIFVGKHSFEDLFYLYQPRLVTFAFIYLKDKLEAEDIVQDVFLHVWNNRKDIHSKENISSYLFTIVKNRCFNVLKHRIVEGKYVEYQTCKAREELYHISFQEENEFVSMDLRLEQEIDRVMEKMSQRCSYVFRLRWLEGKKIREIAEIMNISTTAVDKHIVKGLIIAKQYLTP